jgi:PhnB protein
MELTFERRLMMQVIPYLTFSGNCEEAFRHYAQVLGGNIGMMMKYEDMPDTEPGMPGRHGQIMHARLVAGDSTLMGSDSPPENFERPAGISINLQVDSVEEAERLYQALSEGGEVRMPLAETFWAVRFAMFVDRFGIPWMINCEKRA